MQKLWMNLTVERSVMEVKNLGRSLSKASDKGSNKRVHPMMKGEGVMAFLISFLSFCSKLIGAGRFLGCQSDGPETE